MIRQRLQQDRVPDFFWPGFADMMLASLLVVVVVLGWTVLVALHGEVNLREAQERERGIVESLASSFSTKATCISEDVKHGISEYEIGIETNGSYDRISIRNELDRQRISFSDQLLFVVNNADLSLSGRHVLRRVGAVLLPNLDSLQEIQVHGHADSRRPTNPKYSTNMSLAAARAIEVFMYFRDSLHVDPTEHLMSATSYGEYLPVGRDPLNSNYSKLQWDVDQDQTDVGKMDRNRRVEIQLVYRK